MSSCLHKSLAKKHVKIFLTCIVGNCLDKHRYQAHNLYIFACVSALLHRRHPGNDSILPTDTSDNDLKNIFTLLKEQLNNRFFKTVIWPTRFGRILLVEW